MHLGHLGTFFSVTTVWALDLPRVHKTTYAPVIYTGLCIMFWRRGYTLLFFGPQMALAYRLDAISQGPKNSGIPGPNTFQLPDVMYIHASKTLCTGVYKSQVHRLFYAHEGGLGPHTVVTE